MKIVLKACNSFNFVVKYLCFEKTLLFFYGIIKNKNEFSNLYLQKMQVKNPKGGENNE